MFDVIARTERLAGEMQKAMRERGLRGFGPAKCRDLVARMFGSSGHRALMRRFADDPMRPDESAWTEAQIVQIRNLQAELLVAFGGLDEATARDLVRDLAPAAPAAPSSPEFFIRPGDLVREASGAVFGKAFVRRRLIELSLTQVADEKAQALTRFADPEDVLELVPAAHAFEAIGAAIELSESGGSLEDMETCFHLSVWALATMGDDCEIEEEAGVQLLACVAEAAGFRQKTPKVPIGLEFMKACTVLFHGLGLLDSIVDDCDRSAEAGCLRFTETLAAIRDLRTCAVTFGDIAAFCATHAVDIGPRTVEDVVDDDLETSVTLDMLSEHARQIEVPSRAICERAWREALNRMVSRGAPHIFLDPYAATDWHFEDDVALVFDDDSFTMLSDALVAAGLAGYGIVDLVRSGIEAAATRLEFTAVSGRQKSKWRKTFKALRQGPGRVVPELAMAALAIGLDPDPAGDPADFERIMEEARLLEQAGVGLDDLTAYSMSRLAVDEELFPLWCDGE